MSERVCRHCGNEIRPNMTGSYWFDQSDRFECSVGVCHAPTDLPAAPAPVTEPQEEQRCDFCKGKRDPVIDKVCAYCQRPFPPPAPGERGETDTKAFWRDSYERAESENTNLRATFTALEARLTEAERFMTEMADKSEKLAAEASVLLDKPATDSFAGATAEDVAQRRGYHVARVQTLGYIVKSVRQFLAERSAAK